MAREGEPYDYGVFGVEYAIKVDRSGVPAMFGHIGYYDECPGHKEIVWTATE